jgi:hypothetical protein
MPLSSQSAPPERATHRYKDVRWLAQERRWPPALVASLQAFLQLKSI